MDDPVMRKEFHICSMNKLTFADQCFRLMLRNTGGSTELLAKVVSVATENESRKEKLEG